MTTTAPVAPQRAEGLELLGALGGSGYRDAPGMVRRGDGQTLQLTPLLYAVLEELDGRRGPDELAAAVSEKVGKRLTGEDLQYLVDTKLSPLGVLHGDEPGVMASSNPLLRLRWKFVVSNPATTRRLTAPFAVLFSPYVLWPVLAAFVAVCWFVLVDKGLASATHSAFESPGLLLGVFALGVLSAGIHELGHAAACRYGGATPGAMGAGVYLVWPAFYTNVDDSYRLPRRGRLRVDLGGLYFNALVAVAVTLAWLATREDALLLGVALQLLQMLRQLAPVIRADGYHILSDLTGVPDLFAHLGPTLRRVLPSHWREPSPLTRKARWIVTGWVLVVVPVLLSMMVTGALLLPRLIATAWESGQVQLDHISSAAESGDFLSLGAGALKLVALLLPVLGTSYLLMSVVRRGWAAAWSRTEERPVRRGLLTGLAVLLLTALIWTWWPQGQYEPVRADERGTLGSLVTQLRARPAPAASRPVMGTQLPALAMVPRGDAAKDHPVLLLLQHDDGSVQTLVTSNDGGAATAFPFVLPDAPGEGDTQALAVNTTDGSVQYDVAYALVTVTGGDTVTNQNSAYALASCTACTTVAVSFQVVLVVGQSDVVVPVNAAVAANGNCIQCVTSALAVQLIATLKDLPSEQVQAQLQDVMSQLDGLEGLDPASLYKQVTAVESQVLTILEDNNLLVDSTTTTTSATATPTPAGAAPSGSSAPTAGATSRPSASTEPTASPTATPGATTSASPEPTTAPSP